MALFKEARELAHYLCGIWVLSKTVVCRTKEGPRENTIKLGLWSQTFSLRNIFLLYIKWYCLNVYLKSSCAGNILPQCSSFEREGLLRNLEVGSYQNKQLPRVSLGDLLSVFHLLPCYVLACQMPAPCPWTSHPPEFWGKQTSFLYRSLSLWISATATENLPRQAAQFVLLYYSGPQWQRQNLRIEYLSENQKKITGDHLFYPFEDSKGTMLIFCTLNIEKLQLVTSGENYRELHTLYFLK